jgi:hypothetical protein
MRSITVGSKVLFEGFTYQVVGITGDHAAIFHPEVSNTAAFLVPVSRLTLDAEATFEIGDKVCSHLSFRGRVTGFEKETNRVICKSDRQNDRVRYAYKPHELKHVRHY